ncbi:MAG: hypothetical protein ACI9ON_000223 [Limisphaerales bacterium]
MVSRLLFPGLTIALTSIAIGSLGACSFVKVSDAGAAVAQANSTDVVNCQSLGEVESQTRAKVLLNRNSGSVQQELIDLARNQASGMGANAIVAIGLPIDGKQKFNVYRCD